MLLPLVSPTLLPLLSHSSLTPLSLEWEKSGRKVGAVWEKSGKRMGEKPQVGSVILLSAHGYTWGEEKNSRKVLG